MLLLLLFGEEECDEFCNFTFMRENYPVNFVILFSCEKTIFFDFNIIGDYIPKFLSHNGHKAKKLMG